MSDCRKCARFEECLVDEDYGLFVKKPMTNADRIRAMTDEELASFFAACDASRFRMRCETEEVRAETWRWLDWLKEEVDDAVK